MKYPIIKPIIDDKEIKSVTSVLKSGWITQGPKVEEFESKFANLVGSKFAVAVTSCTAALHLSLKAIGVTAGDEVIVPSLSFIATANAIRYCGAIPNFVDIEINTFNLNPELVETAINEKTKAILCVHQMGMPCDLERLLKISNEYSIPIIEDAACALGSRVSIKNNWDYIGKPHGKIATFSFHPRKVITTGEGGMLTTNDRAIFEKLKLLRQHGMSISDRKRHQAKKIIFEEYKTLGYNYRLTDIHAAIGIVQLGKLRGIISRRRKIAELYFKQLSSISKVIVPTELSWQKSNWQSFCVGIDLPKRSVHSVMDYLLKCSISTRRGIQCAHLEDTFKIEPWNNCSKSKLEKSKNARDLHIILPLFDEMKCKDVKFVCDKLNSAILKFS